MPSSIVSADSTRPMLTQRDSTDSNTINEIDEGLRRLDDRRLVQQRFVPTEQKAEMLQKLALGAKVERALRWRMEGQDYVPRLPCAKSG